MKEDTFTSIHVEEFELQVRETKQGPEEMTKELPNVGRPRSGTSTRSASSHSAEVYRNDTSSAKSRPGRNQTLPGGATASRDLRRRP